MNPVQDFINQVNGQRLQVTDADGGQCTAVAHKLQQYLGLPLTFGNAKDMFGEDAANWTWVENSADAVPPPGAQIIWGAMPGNPYGHIAMVISANKDNFTSLDQNWPIGANAHPVYHNYAYVLGWGIAKKLTGANVAGVDERYAEDWAREAYIIGTARIASRDERRLRVTLPWDEAFNAIYGSPEAINAQKRIIKSAFVSVLNRDPKNPCSDAELADRLANLNVTYTYPQMIEEFLASDERKNLEAEWAKRKVVEPTPAPPAPPAAEDPTKKPTTPTGPATELPPAQQPSPAEVAGVFQKLYNWIFRK